MKRMMSIALLALLGVTAACDDDSTGPGVTGTFQLELTGALEETADGPAWFGPDVNEDGEPVFLLLLGDAESRHLMIAGRPGAARPPAGTYTIGETGWEFVHIVSDDEELLGVFLGVEGEINITSSSSSFLRGTIDYVATGLFGEDDAEIEGSISFEAVPAPAAAAVRTLSAVRSRR